MMKINLLETIRFTTATLERISPRMALWWVSRLFFSPRRGRREMPELPNLEQRWLSFTAIDGSQSKCRIYSSGTGPVVLLIHGWEGSASSFTAIARRLLDEGHRVVLFDLPAHGYSPGKKTNLVEIGRVIKKLEDEEGKFHAIIGHSFGAACAGHAIKSGVSMEHFVSISAPTTMSFIIDRFCYMVGASEKTRQGLIQQIDAILQGPHEQESLTELAANFKPAGLIVHDRKDRVVPYSHAEAFSSAWPGARLFDTHSLGHSRILKDEEVIQVIASRIWPGENWGQSKNCPVPRFPVQRSRAS